MKSDRRAFLLPAFFLILAVICICTILFRYHQSENGEALLAEVYQNGSLIHSFRLDQVNSPFTLTVHTEDGGYNLIEIRPGSIGICSADCPDKLCVSQGFLSDSLLPITCLPHRLVIQIRKP